MEQRIKKEIIELKGLPDDVKWTEERGWSRYNKKYRSRKQSKLFYWKAVAAVVFVAILVSILVNSYSNKNRIIELSSSSQQKKELVLADGSRIWINYNTLVRINNKKREIEIVGEAYLELTENVNYKLRFPQGKLQTEGCKFNIRALENSEEALVTVSKGNLEMIWESDITLLEQVEANEQVKIIPQLALVKTENPDNNYLAWKTEELHFKNAPLFAVIDKLEDIHDVEIELSEHDLRYCTVSSEFKSATLTTIMNELQKQLDSKVENIGNKYLIVGDGC